MKNRLRQAFTTKEKLEYTEYVHTQWYVDPCVPIVLEEGIDVVNLHCHNNRHGKDIHEFNRFEIPRLNGVLCYEFPVTMRMPLSQQMFESSTHYIVTNKVYPMPKAKFNTWIKKVTDKITDVKKCGVMYRFDGAIFGSGKKVDENDVYEDVQLEVVIPEVMNVFTTHKDTPINGMMVPPYLVTIADKNDDACMVLHIRSRTVQDMSVSMEKTDDSILREQVPHHIPYVDIYLNKDSVEISKLIVSVAKRATPEVREKVVSDCMLIPPTYKLGKDYVTFHQGSKGLVAEKIGWKEYRKKEKKAYTVVTEDIQDAILMKHELEPLKNSMSFSSSDYKKRLVDRFNDDDSKEIAAKLTSDISSLNDCSINAEIRSEGIFFIISFECYFYPRKQMITGAEPDVFYISKVYEIGKVIINAVKRRFDSLVKLEDPNKKIPEPVLDNKFLKDGDLRWTNNSTSVV